MSDHKMGNPFDAVIEEMEGWGDCSTPETPWDFKLAAAIRVLEAAGRLNLPKHIKVYLGTEDDARGAYRSQVCADIEDFLCAIRDAQEVKNENCR